MFQYHAPPRRPHFLGAVCGRGLALVLVCSLWFPRTLEAGPGPLRPDVRLDIGAAATTADGADCSLWLRSRSLDMRLWLDWPFRYGDDSLDAVEPLARVGLRAPFLTVGAVRTSGLAAFLYRPAGAGLMLLELDGSALALDNPEYARYQGIVLGDDFGLFGVAPESQADRPAYGAWISPRGGSLSLLIAGSVEPADEGGPSWYDPPSPASGRLWPAGGFGGSGSGWAWALAGASTSGYPGPDAAAGRAEGRMSLGHLCLTAVASAAGASWRAPDGADSSALRVDTEARYARRGFAVTLGWRVVQDDDHSPPMFTYRGSSELVGTVGRIYAAGTMDTTPTGGLPDVSVATSWRPGFASWARIGTSWVAAAGESQRFDVLADIRLGRIAGFALSGGVRFLPEGPCVKASGTVSVPLGSLVVEVGARTSDWTGASESLIDAMVYSACVRTRIDFTSFGK